MPGVRVRVFGGMSTATGDRHLGPTLSSHAYNTELRDGALRAFREPKEVARADFDVATVVELPSTSEACGAPLLLDYCATVTYPLDPGCAGMTKAIVWSEGPQPHRWYDPSDKSWHPVVVPAPEVAPVAVRTTAGTLETEDFRGPDQRAYTYTWVDRFNAESPPAPPSAAVAAYDDEVWRVTTSATPPANAAAIRIYRTSSDLDPEPAQNPASFQLVAEVPIADWSGTFFDDLRLIDMPYGTLLTTQNCPPPACLRDVRQLDSGAHVGFAGQDVWFSEVNEPHNWPGRYRITLPFEIMNLVANNDVVYVSTRGNPFTIRTGVMVDEMTGDTVVRANPVMYDQFYPALGRRTMVTTAWGAVYVGREGLVGLQPSLPARVVSRQLIDEDTWWKFMPNRLAWLNGRLYGSRAPHGPGLLMDVRGEPEGPKDLADWVLIDLAATDIHAAPSGRLLLAKGQAAYEWDAGTDRKTYRWRSRRMVRDALLGMRAGKVVGSFGAPVTFRLLLDDRVVFERTVGHRRPFRIPFTSRGLEWQIEIEGSTTVHELHVASSMSELTEAVE